MDGQGQRDLASDFVGEVDSHGPDPDESRSTVSVLRLETRRHDVLRALLLDLHDLTRTHLLLRLQPLDSEDDRSPLGEGGGTEEETKRGRPP